MSKQDERRRPNRILIRLPVRVMFKSLGHTREEPGEVQNLSSEGMYLATEATGEVGRKLVLDLSIRGTDVQIWGCVQWSNEEGWGVEFVDAPEVFRAFVQQLGATSPKQIMTIARTMAGVRVVTRNDS